MRDRIVWGSDNPFGDPRLAKLNEIVSAVRRQVMPPGVSPGGIFENDEGYLPSKPTGYYREYYLTPPTFNPDQNMLRLVLGRQGEVYITGDHYQKFRRVISMPAG